MTTQASKLSAPPPSAPPPRAATVPWGPIKDEKIGRRVCIYGQGGMGKTSLAAHAPGNILFMDFDKSLPVLKTQLGDATKKLASYTPDDWPGILSTLGAYENFAGIDSIVIDTATKAEELSQKWVVANVPTEKGVKVANIEAYGFKTGYRHAFDQWLKLLSILDQHVAKGRNVVFVCHLENSNAANPGGEDFLRAEPRLCRSMQGNLREKIFEWCDFVLYLDEEKAVSKEGKAAGNGSRAIYTSPQAWFKAKKRGPCAEIIYPDADNLADVWTQLFV